MPPWRVANRLPLFLLRPEPGVWQSLAAGARVTGRRADADPGAAPGARAGVGRLAALRLCLCHAARQARRPRELAKRSLDALPPGITHLVLHPAVDTPELRAITGDWPSRVADYKAFTSRELKAHVRRSGLHVIGYGRWARCCREAGPKAGV